MLKASDLTQYPDNTLNCVVPQIPCYKGFTIKYSRYYAGYTYTQEDTLTVN